MNRPDVRVGMGLAGAAAIAAAARRSRALSSGGAIAATIVGGAVVAGTGLRGGASLIAFFLSSTLLGRLPTATSIEQHRGNERDAVQVIANGGAAAVLAVTSWLGSDRVRLLLLTGFGGAIAAATADTWATEIGSRSRQRPRSIATLSPVPRGKSGGVTLAGLTASAVGAALIAITTSVDLRDRPGHVFMQAIPVALGGFMGSLVDSVLGATVQEVRFCDHCLLESEQRVHRCGTQTRRIRGLSWCDNDAVNAIATMAGAATAVIIDVSRANRGLPSPSRTERGPASEAAIRTFRSGWRSGPTRIADSSDVTLFSSPGRKDEPA